MKVKASELRPGMVVAPTRYTSEREVRGVVVAVLLRDGTRHELGPEDDVEVVQAPAGSGTRIAELRQRYERLMKQGNDAAAHHALAEHDRLVLGE